MNGDVRNIGLESVGFTQIGGKRVSNSGGNGLHAPAKVAHEVDVHVLVDCVIRRCAMANVRVGNQTYRLEYLECAIDGREVDSRGGVLDLDQNFFRGPVPEIFNGLKDELPLRRNSKAVLAKSLLPVLGHS